MKKSKIKIIKIDEKQLKKMYLEYRRVKPIWWSYDDFIVSAGITYMSLEALKQRVRRGSINALACWGVLKDIKREYVGVLGDILMCQQNHPWIKKSTRIFDFKQIQYLHKIFSEELRKDEEIAGVLEDASIAPILENKSGFKVAAPVKVKVIS